MKDLEIRGAGDLLGGEQSGFINEMGFDAYQKIMQEALEELENNEEFENIFKNNEDREKLFKTNKDVNIDTDLELMLPDSYISNTEERLTLYQKLSELENKKELNQFTEEIIDRFGTLPIEASNLLKSIELKWHAMDIGFEKIILKNDVFLGYFSSNPQDKFYQSEQFKKIINFLTLHPQDAQLKEKIGKDGTSLMMRKENIKNIDDLNYLLNTILNS